MSDGIRNRLQAATVAFAPLFLLAALAYHPYIRDLTDKAEVAGAMSVGVTRWGLAHVAVGVGFGLLLLALLAVRSLLREAGEQRWSAPAVPFLVMGTIFATFLPAMETGMIPAFQAGVDAVALQTNLSPWFVPMMVAGALVFGTGVILLAAGIVASGVFERQQARIIAGALAVVAISRFVPQGRALYAGAVAGVIALAPVAVRMWAAVPGYSRRRPAPTAGSYRPAR
ncbi:MAG TPA: hypothetical protein VM754_11695 [Actinomycetota bacterium]|nr:hypothetical protein [Actinomycetota bacterium]